MHKKFIALALAAVVLAGCETTLESVGLGAGLGAVGATLVGGDAATGAVVGGGVALLCEETNSCY